MKPKTLLALVPIVAGLVCCSAPAPQSGASSCHPGAEVRVKLLSQPAPDSLTAMQHPVWSRDHLILQLGPSQQWTEIRGRAPEPALKGDFGVDVYAVYDKTYWYLAVDVTDDKILENSADPEHLYSGDVFELFMASDNLDFPEDFSELVRLNAGPRRAFFQIQVPPKPLADASWHFSSYRTDPQLKLTAAARGFAVHTEQTRSGWRAILKIPFDLLDREVVGEDKHVKVGIDFLDYDDRIASPGMPFLPHNVASPDRDERNVNCPACMRRVIFEN